MRKKQVFKSEGSCDICMLTQNTAPSTAPFLADPFCNAERVDPISVFSSAASTRLRKCSRVAMHVSVYFGDLKRAKPRWSRIRGGTALKPGDVSALIPLFISWPITGRTKYHLSPIVCEHLEVSSVYENR